MRFKTILDKDSKFQNITLGYMGKMFYMLLDGTMQITIPGEEKYHKALIDTPIKLLGRKPKRVLILGGGDGGAARNALRYRPREIIQVEIDPEVIKIARTHPVLKKMNQGSLDKIKIIIGDALRVPYMKLGKFDLIAVDLTEPDDNSDDLYSRAYLSKLIDMLKDDGILSVYHNDELRSFAGAITNIVNIKGWGEADLYYYKKQ